MYHKISCIQMTSGNNVADNLKQAEKWINAAVAQGAECVVLPEMFALMGVEPAVMLQHKEIMGSGVIQDFLAKMAAKNHLWIVGGTLPIASSDENKVYAACLVFDNYGDCVARYDKMHLFDVKIALSGETYSESNQIIPGDRITVVNTPFGKLGIAVCYDLRFPEMFRRMHAEAVEIIVVPSAFTYATGLAHWEILLRARAIENLCYVAAAGQTGVHANQRKTYGHSMIIAPWGNVLAVLPEEQGIVTAEIDLAAQRKIREEFPVILHKKL